MEQESTIQIQVVHGGFILQSYDDTVVGGKTEVFTSQGKLLKAVRGLLDMNSLVAKSKDKVEVSEEAE